jgi:hypothetical protein
MTLVRSYERFNHAGTWILGAIDLFAAVRTSKTTVPPILGAVKFFIVRRLTAPATTYETPLEFISWTNPSGYFLFSGEVRKPGRFGSVALGSGQYEWRVESDYYQPIEFVDTWPPAEVEDKTFYDKTKDLKFVPGPAYPFPKFLQDQRDLVVTTLRGSLFTAAGAPIENVVIRMTAPVLGPRYEGFLDCRTDKRGNWVISFIEKAPAGPGDPVPDFAHSTIRVNLPGSAAYDADLAITPGKENALRQTALRGRVTQPGGAGISGAKVSTSVDASQSLSKPDGQWFFYFELRQPAGAVTVTAVSPDGLTNNAQSQIVPGVTTVVPAIELS